MTHKINLKSIVCKDCNLLFTSPSSHNEHSNEFTTFKKRKYQKNVEVIDKDNQLRAMTTNEKINHLNQINETIEKTKSNIKTKNNKNNFTVVKTKDDNDFIEFEIKVDLVEGIIVEKNNTTSLKCPNCNKVAFTIK